MHNKLLPKNIGSTIDKYAATITLFLMGIFLQINPSFLLSYSITRTAQTILYGTACVILIKIGRNLEQKNIAGVPEIAVGAFQVYTISRGVPHDGYWSFLFLCSVGFFLFTFIGGSLAFICSILQVKKNRSTDLLSKTESIVAILTSLIAVVFAGIELLVQ